MKFSRTQLLLWIALAFSRLPAFAIVIPATGSSIAGAITDPSAYLAPFNAVKDGVNLNGVVLVQGGGLSCSGALIGPTQVLTAAHCINGATPTVGFVNGANSDGSQSFLFMLASSYLIDPDYGGTYANGADLAIVNLASAAPGFATIYQLYSGPLTIDSTIVLAGFGATGDGDTGGTTLDGQRRVGENSYGANGSFLGASSNLLVGDFSDGTAANNPLSTPDLTDEVDIAHGDSGGPSFYDGQLVGVHDIIGCMANGCTPNSFYGEVFADTSVEANASWIEAGITPEPSSWILCMSAAAIMLFLRRELD